MEIFRPLSPVVPVFLLIAAGFIFAHWKKISLASVTEIIVYVGTPSLVFSSLAGKPLFAVDIATLAGGVLLIFAGVGFVIWLYFFFFRFSSRGFAMPSLFMNAGNMGVPLALFAFGQAGMQRATFLLVIITRSCSSMANRHQRRGRLRRGILIQKMSGDLMVKKSSIDPRRCPLCGQSNECAIAAGKNPCWCFSEPVPQAVLRSLPVEARDVACVCRSCAMSQSALERALGRMAEALRWR